MVHQTLWLTLFYTVLCLILPIKAEFRPRDLHTKQVARAFAHEKFPPNVERPGGGVWGFGLGGSSSTQPASTVPTQPSSTSSIPTPSPQPTSNTSPTSPEPEPQSPGSPAGDPVAPASGQTTELATDTSSPTQTFASANGPPSGSAEYPPGAAPSQDSSTETNFSGSSLNAEYGTQTTAPSIATASPDATPSTSGDQRLTSGQGRTHNGASVGIVLGALSGLTIFTIM